MSLYNMVNGVNPAVWLILPMLGKHPDEYPRFRDCFIGQIGNSKELDFFGIPIKERKQDGYFISVYTRTGGGNRDSYINDINEIKTHIDFIKEYDDDFDSTFMYFVFNVPERFKDDFDKIKDGNLKGVSDEYKKTILDIYPKLKNQLEKVLY